ncbi:MAG: ABC transporter ATP-binding protein, partial [Oscillospiraceae bacterium]|nr:ABC transporter ATP-binding protein [Oscillospiraceae bacterium]
MRFEVRNGSFRYPKSERQVLQNVSFAAEAGEVTAILGPNGAGKTTLLRCAMGLLKWNGGGSYLDGKDIRRLSYRELWQKVAYVPQARQASDAYTVEEMVLLGRSARIGRFSLPGKEDLAAAAAALERLGLSRYAARRCSELSGGELQMVLIARALASQPEVLILDEPESNLDFKNQLLVLDTMTSLA